MLKTLIVDDEKLVRSELRHLVDWADYQIEIVGEAENGRMALRFLEQHPDTDLMISDLTMPGISGIEFLETVRQQHPHVRIVVMTMHQDFDLLQQALRLGAVDYITKTQIERQNFSKILKNLLKRLASVPGETCCEADELSVCINIQPDQPSTKMEHLQKITENIWILPPNETPPPDNHFLSLHISDTFGKTFRQLTTYIQDYLHTRLFYLYRPDCRDYRLSYKDTTPVPPDERDQLAARMKGSDWLVQEKLYRQILQKIPGLGMTREELTVFLYQPYLYCASFLNLTPTDYFTQIEHLDWWYQWSQWLENFRNRVMPCLYPQGSPAYAIQEAMEYVRLNYGKDLSLSDILEITSMSKSSFSKLFKEQAGMTFGEYLKKVRMESAQKLLAHTEFSIAQIGEQTGYLDERNFRRAFLEYTGCSPAHYRKTQKRFL